MSQQSEMADSVYRRLGCGPVPAALLVRELRDRWGEDHSFMSVHALVREVATCLLRHDDVKVGDLRSGVFVAWTLDPDEADTRFSDELLCLHGFLEDKSLYVFNKTTQA